LHEFSEHGDTSPSSTSTTAESKASIFFNVLFNMFYLDKKVGSEPPPSQIVSINTIYSSLSPIATLAAPLPTVVVRHYYQDPPHHNVMCRHHILSAATSNSLYLMEP
jgi:hypothetical protein